MLNPGRFRQLNAIADQLRICFVQGAPWCPHNATWIFLSNHNPTFIHSPLQYPIKCLRNGSEVHCVPGILWLCVLSTAHWTNLGGLSQQPLLGGGFNPTEKKWYFFFFTPTQAIDAYAATCSCWDGSWDARKSKWTSPHFKGRFIPNPKFKKVAPIP